MASRTIQFCPLCGEDLPKGSSGAKPTCHGVSLSVSVSMGGWGRASEVLGFSDEVCLTCFAILGKGMAALQKSLDEARSRRP